MPAIADVPVPAPAAARETPFVVFAVLTVAYVAACVSFVLAGAFPVNNPDTFGHLAQGRQIVELGYVPLRDTLSFWQPRPAVWHNYEWLSDWLTYGIYAAGGANALIAAKCALLAVSAALLVKLADLIGGARVALLCALLAVFAIPGARFRFTERPHLVTLPFVALYLIGFAYLLRAWGEGNRRADAGWIAAIALVHLAWVNLHGSHLLGLAVSCIFFALSLRDRDARRKLGLVLALQLVVSCISPYGPAISIDAIKHMVDPRYRQLVTEWQPWQAEDPLWLFVAPFVQTLALAFAVKPLMRGGLCERALLGCACLLALAAFRSVRFVAEYLVLSAPIIAIGLGPSLGRLSRRAFGALSGAGFVLAAAVVPWASLQSPPYTGIALGMRTMGLPLASGQWLAEHTEHPRVLAAIEDSWVLMFAVPGARFLVDGRVPFYGPEHIARVGAAFSTPGKFDELLRSFDVNVVVVRHTFKPHQALLQSIRTRSDWSLVSIEDRSSVFVRNDIALRGGGHPQRLALEPNYELDWLLHADAARKRAILGALDALPHHDNTRGYQDWVHAVFALEPFLRAGQGNGLLPPATPSQVGALRQISAWLERAAAGTDGVPVVYAYHALSCAALCDLECAERALAEARREGDSRETLLGAQEIALRRGDTAQVAAFLQQASAVPGAAGDAWLQALREGLKVPPACPPGAPMPRWARR